MKKHLIIYLLINNLFTSLASEDSLSRVIDVQVQKFRNILETVYSNYYLEDVDFVGISENAFNSLLQSLDKFSNYYSTDQYQNLKDSYKGSTKGVGVQFFRRGDSLIIFHIVRGSPADSIGLEIGDRIIYINHEYCIGKDANFANKKILDSKNNFSIITIRRNNVLKEFVVPVRDIEIPSVISKVKIGEDIGYIRINRFSLETYDEFINSFDSLAKIGCKSLVLDLRNNQGGYLDVVVNICKLFLKKGDTVVVVSGRGDNKKVHITEQQGKYLKVPIIVLVDENTASGGEILASCLQDNDRAIVVGTRTFGKGLVQRTWEFRDGSAFRMTTAEYVSPLGRKIQKENSEKFSIDGQMDVNLPFEQKKEIEDFVKKFGGKSQYQIFYTKKGRALISFGGVIPDYFFVSDTTPQYLKKLRSNGFLNDFVLKHFIDDQKNFSLVKKHSFASFVLNFSISQDAISNFKQYLIQRNVLIESNFSEEFEAILLELKATLGYILFGDLGYYSTIVTKDKILNKVFELRNEAEKLLKN